MLFTDILPQTKCPFHLSLGVTKTVINSLLFSYGQINCNFISVSISVCLQCFDAVGWAAGRASGL